MKKYIIPLILSCLIFLPNVYALTGIIIGTTNNLNGSFGSGAERRTCFSNGYYYVIWMGNNNVTYGRSLDTITWLTQINIHNNTGSGFSMYCLSPYVYFVFTYTSKISMSRALVNPDGTLTLGIEYIISPISILSNTGYITINSTGYPWVSWVNSATVSVAHNNQKDGSGTWTIDTLSESGFGVGPVSASVLPLSNGTNLLFVLGLSGGIPTQFGIGARKYTTSWGSEIISGTNNLGAGIGGMSSTLDTNNNVWLTFWANNALWDIEYFNDHASWGALNQILNGITQNNPSISWDGGSNIFEFWTATTVISSRQYLNLDHTTFIDKTYVNDTGLGTTLVSMIKAQNNLVIVSYTNGTSNPFNVKVVSQGGTSPSQSNTTDSLLTLDSIRVFCGFCYISEEIKAPECSITNNNQDIGCAMGNQIGAFMSFLFPALLILGVITYGSLKAGASPKVVLIILLIALNAISFPPLGLLPWFIAIFTDIAVFLLLFFGRDTGTGTVVQA